MPTLPDPDAGNPWVTRQFPSPDGTYVEICELPDHPWFLGCQFHPEFKSKPLEPHPLFVAFIGAAYEHRRRRLAAAETREPQYSRGD